MDFGSLVVEQSAPKAQQSVGVTYGCDDLETDALAVFTDITKNAGLCYATAISPEAMKAATAQQPK